jgi:predicted nucleotidyltransferase component of viral defense system
VTPPEPKNLPASIHQRLLNQARASGRRFDELLRYYAIERLLYRLSKSPYRDRFVLKGALIFAAWGAPLGRSTRDVDLLAYTGNAIDEVVTIFKAICTQSVEADGMDFEPATVAGESITEHAEYQGVRVRFQGHLGDARVRMQIDLGFGDVITPAANWVEYPSLLGQPRPVLRGYPPETVVAEKTQALVRLGTLNSRMKDFYDLWLLARQFDFDGGAVSEALIRTMAHRNTPIPTELPEALANEFGKSKQAQWQAFLRTAGVAEAPQSLVVVLEELRGFLLPLLRTVSRGTPLLGKWPASGPWKDQGGIGE